MKTLVNPATLKALTKKELLEKHDQYWRLGEIKADCHFFEIAKVYLHEYKTRPLIQSP